MNSLRRLLITGFGLVSLLFTTMLMAASENTESLEQTEGNTTSAKAITTEAVKRPIDYRLLALRLGESERDLDAMYSQMGEFKKVVRISDVYEQALAVVLLPEQEYQDYKRKGHTDYSENPMLAFFYSYESFYMTHHHNYSPKELIDDALDFYYGRNGTKQDVQAAQFMLKKLRSYNKVEFNKALDALLASKELTIEF